MLTFVQFLAEDRADKIHNVLHNYGYEGAGNGLYTHPRLGHTASISNGKWSHTAHGKAKEGHLPGNLDKHLANLHQSDLFGNPTKAPAKKVRSPKPHQPPSVLDDHSGQLSMFEDDNGYHGYHFKGWMSPSGKAHIFPPSREHAENHHPEYLNGEKQPQDNHKDLWHSKQIHAAQKKGFVRFGRAKDSIHGHHAYIHYDGTHPEGHKTALKALKWMGLHHDEEVSYSGHPGALYSRKIRKDLEDRTMPASAASRDLAKKTAKLKEDDDWPGWTRGNEIERRPGMKGWMSPSGKPHMFVHYGEHKRNHHPEYLAQGGKENDPLEHAQAKGFVRFGANANSFHGKHHFIHYDDRHPKGRETALKALNFMAPEHNDEVTVSGRGGLFKNGKANPTTMKQLGREAVVPASKAAALIRAGKNTKSPMDLRKSKLMGKKIDHPQHGPGTINFVGVDHAMMGDHYLSRKWLQQHGHIKEEHEAAK